MTVKWTTSPGSLGIIVERVIQNVELQATSDTGVVKFTLQAGSLPRGLRLSNVVENADSVFTTHIVGSPVEVKRFTESRFVLRATEYDNDNNIIDIDDRTFGLSVDGTDIPQWLTAEGFLNIGPANAYFVLDNSEVDFQLEATDTDEIVGDSLEFYLTPSAGELPPGLTLTTDGRITGFTDPIFALEYQGAVAGGYDAAPFDYLALDILKGSSTGFDNYLYDNTIFDYSEESKMPRRLSRAYTFVVSVTDGLNTVNRLFRIYVVTEEFLKADNSIIQVDTNIFQADSDNRRVPIWITESNLGRIRSNNYVTIFLEVYDPPSLTGIITYVQEDKNPGTYRIKETGQTTTGNYEISNTIPRFRYSVKGDWDPTLSYKVADSVIYKDDVDLDIKFQTWVCIATNKNVVPVEGQYWTKQNVYRGLQNFSFSNNSFWETIIPETTSQIPPGLTLDTLTGELAGRVPYQARVSKTYTFTMTAINFPNTLGDLNYSIIGDWSSATVYSTNDAVRYQGLIYIARTNHFGKVPIDEPEYWYSGVTSAPKTFTVDIIGEIESGINWISDPDLGSIKPNQPSQKSVTAESLLYGGRVSYEMTSGTLPPGLVFLSSGSINGKVKQFADNQGPGLTRFYEQLSDTDDSSGSRDYNVGFSDNTTFNKKFSFTVKAKDGVNFAENVQTFFITVISDNTKTFANLYARAFQSKEKRLSWYNFITDVTIFTPASLYRYGDKNFGIQPDLKMLVYAGIESVEAVKYVQAMSRNHYRKRLLFGEVKKAKAKDPVTQDTIYEVVYVNVIDDYEKDGISVSNTIELSNNINSPVLVSYDKIKVDSNIPFVSDRDHQRIFPNSIHNMRDRISTAGERDREFLPDWMRSIQDQASYQTGYVKALVLCYCNPGAADSIILKIKASEFDFKSIDFTMDRFVIDIIDGEIQDKYLAFPQRGEKLP